MARIVIIKHGETLWDGEGRIPGNLDIPLKARGGKEFLEAQVALKSLDIRTFHTGPSSACRETAKILARLHRARVIEREDLAEVNLGLWQGLLETDVIHRYRTSYRQWREDPTRVAPPGGETVEAARDRLVAAVEAIAGGRKAGTFGIVAGSVAWAILVAHFRKVSLSDIPGILKEDRLWEAFEISSSRTAKAS
ncbi:MAG: histidine phosphatase family protein [Planctomycetota bacterium]